MLYLWERSWGPQAGPSGPTASNPLPFSCPRCHCHCHQRPWNILFWVLNLRNNSHWSPNCHVCPSVPFPQSEEETGLHSVRQCQAGSDGTTTYLQAGLNEPVTTEALLQASHWVWPVGGTLTKDHRARNKGGWCICSLAPPSWTGNGSG